MFLDVFTIISNLWFILPLVRAYHRRRYVRMLIYAGILINSSIYHTCNSFRGACWINADFHRKMDFWFAMMVIPASALYIVYFTPEESVLEIVLLFLFGLGTLYTQQLVRDSIYLQIVLTGASFLIIFGYWIWYAAQNKWKLPTYRWDNLFWAIGLTALACMLYVAEMADHTSYWAVHSVWHINAAYAQYFLLGIRDDPYPKNIPGLFKEIK